MSPTGHSAPVGLESSLLRAHQTRIDILLQPVVKRFKVTFMLRIACSAGIFRHRAQHGPGLCNRLRIVPWKHYQLTVFCHGLLHCEQRTLPHQGEWRRGLTVHEQQLGDHGHWLSHHRRHHRCRGHAQRLLRRSLHNHGLARTTSLPAHRLRWKALHNHVQPHSHGTCPDQRTGLPPP